MPKAVSSPILRLIRQVAQDQGAQQLSDLHLLRQFTDRKDETAFAMLLRRHGAMVLDVSRGVLGNEADAEDVFQATFLILARKAPSIRKMASVGSWLHGVAYRTALKVRAQSVRRQHNQAQVPPRSTCEPDDLTWREVRQVLHEELIGLTERYRAPLVACYLEGKTQDEAAALLGVAKSTLKERLARGRMQLRARLVRRGLGPAAILLAAAWPSASSATCLPPMLASTTTKAAAQFTLSQGSMTAAVSLKVASLTEGVLGAMLMTRLKIMAAVLLTITLAGSAATFIGARVVAQEASGRIGYVPPGITNAMAIESEVALDANGGRFNPYLYSPPDPSNVNHLWQLQKVGDHYMIISKLGELALDANGGKGKPYLRHSDPTNKVLTADGQLLETREDYRATYVWVNRDGGWLIAFCYDDHGRKSKAELPVPLGIPYVDSLFKVSPPAHARVARPLSESARSGPGAP